MNNEDYKNIISLGKAEVVFQVIKIVLALYFVGVSLVMLRMMDNLLLLVGNL